MRPFRLLALLATPLVVMGAFSELEAQSPRPDFLFEQPVFSLTFRGGAFLNRADAQIYRFTTERLTVDRSDFRGATFGAEFAAWLGDRFEFTAGLDGGSTTLDSEYRDWDEEVNGTRIPIRQRTTLDLFPFLTVGGRAYLSPRGEAISRLAWVPTRMNAFVGGGIGGGWYSFNQSGDFVDEDEAIVFSADFTSEGSAFITYVSAGGEYLLSRRTALVGEARYLWGSDDMTGDFARFRDIDLSGLRVTAGLALRF